MTPDKPEQTPDEAVNGVLADTGSIDTTGFGILGGSTEQVEVSLPIDDADDDLDEDVIGDEVVEAYSVEVVDTAVAEIVETGSIATAAVIDDDVVEAEVVDTGAVGPLPSDVRETAHVGEANEPAPEVTVALAADVEQAGAADVSAVGESEDETMRDPDNAADAAADVTPESAEPSPTIETADLDALIAGAIAAHPRGDRGETAAAESAETAEADAAPRAETKPRADAEPVPTATGSIPATRWEANHRPFAVERDYPRTEVTLTSKRLGEMDQGRETADLLTADRLLDPHLVVRPEPEGGWQHFLYAISGKRINLGDSKRARARKELDRRIAAPLTGGARFVPVLSRKGGVGKTTVTTLLGMALADARDDRIIAVDANPDRGTLADRIARVHGRTVRDLVRARADVAGYADISNIVARDETRLDVLASDTDPRVSEAFSDRDYQDVASIAAHYYSIVLTDTGTGIVHSVMGATLGLADELVIVAGLSVDEARLASETITWLETNGYAERVRNAVVVLNHARPGTPLVRADELEAHFRSRVRAVVQIPYDAHIAAGTAITFRDLSPATRQAARELAATVVEGLRSVAVAA
ncbi:MinD/ParA family protein [Microbacterium sp. BWT-B31]|uniref:MinD/ParA family ATP-binding protein n=1 Tax=Microbacterium sp. BWT-B31 TaxID=3232072 RepID=UPI0035274A52